VTRQIIETRDLNIPPFEFNTTGVWVDSTTMQSLVTMLDGADAHARRKAQIDVWICRAVPVWVYGYFAAPVRDHFYWPIW